MSDLVEDIVSIMSNNGLSEIKSKNIDDFIVIKGELKDGCTLVFQTDKESNQEEYCTLLNDKNTKGNAIWRKVNVENFQQIIESAKSYIGEASSNNLPESSSNNLSKVNIIVLGTLSIILVSFLGFLIGRLSSHDCPQSRNVMYELARFNTTTNYSR